MGLELGRVLENLSGGISPAIIWRFECRDEEGVGGLGRPSGKGIGKGLCSHPGHVSRIELVDIPDLSAPLPSFIRQGNRLFAKLRQPIILRSYLHHFAHVDHRRNFSPYNNILLLNFLTQWGFPGPTLLHSFPPAASALEQNNTTSVRKMGLKRRQWFCYI